jgi:hypothetical protein
MRSIVLLMLSLIITSGIDGQQSTALNRKEIRANKKALREAAVDSIIQSGSFTIDVQTALPRGWQAIQLSSLYQITIKGDTIDTHLPYYGRTYTLAFPVSDGGIKLHAPMNEYRMQEKRKQTEITFEARGEHDLYRFNLSVSPGGFVSVDVNSNNRQGIAFNGVLSGLPR